MTAVEVAARAVVVGGLLMAVLAALVVLCAVVAGGRSDRRDRRDGAAFCPVHGLVNDPTGHVAAWHPGAVVRCGLCGTVIEDSEAHRRLWHTPQPVGVEDRADWGAR